ncbi:putative tumor suppressing sub-chromosomal transferable candidate 4, partial [Tanacetum coccineum]
PKKQRSSAVQDYLLNPSNYTRYTFNDDDDDDDHDDKKSNTEVYMEFLDQIKKSKDAGLEQKPPAGELPTSVVFIPRKKRGDAALSNSDGQVKETSTGVGIGIADEVSDMLQDEPDVDVVCTKPPKFQKPSRRYRSKIKDDHSVC